MTSDRIIFVWFPELAIVRDIQFESSRMSADSIGCPPCDRRQPDLATFEVRSDEESTQCDLFCSLGRLLPASVEGHLWSDTCGSRHARERLNDSCRATAAGREGGGGAFARPARDSSDAMGVV